MSSVEKMSVALTAELASMVKAAVETGQYASSSEVIREALRDWKFNHAIREQKLLELRELWQEGIESGPSEIASFKELKAIARKRAGL